MRGEGLPHSPHIHRPTVVHQFGVTDRGMKWSSQESCNEGSNELPAQSIPSVRGLGGPCSVCRTKAYTVAVPRIRILRTMGSNELCSQRHPCQGFGGCVVY